MACTPEDLKSEIDKFLGGSDKRYAHLFNRKFVYSEGFRAVAEKAGAFWLLDIIATECALIFAKEWDAGRAGTGLFRIVVADGVADLSLTLDAPEPAWTRRIDFTDFPEGEWQFYLGRDQGPNETLYTTLFLTTEY